MNCRPINYITLIKEREERKIHILYLMLNSNTQCFVAITSNSSLKNVIMSQYIRNNYGDYNNIQSSNMYSIRLFLNYLNILK